MRLIRRAGGVVAVTVALLGCMGPQARIEYPTDEAQRIEQCREEGCVAVPVGVWRWVIRVLMQVGVIQGS